MLNIQKAGDMDEAKWAKVLLYGKSGSGKTSMAFATAPGPVLGLVSEFNALARIRQVRPDADILMVTKAQDLRDALTALRGPLSGRYRTVVMDSLTDFQEMLRKEMMAREANKESLTIQEWGVLGEQTVALVKGFRGEPFHLISICLDEETGDEGAKWLQPALYGRAAKVVPSLYTAVGYLFREPDPDPKRAGRVRYRALWESTQRVVTKPVQGLDPKTDPDVALVLKAGGYNLDGYKGLVSMDEGDPAGDQEGDGSVEVGDGEGEVAARAEPLTADDGKPSAEGPAAPAAKAPPAKASGGKVKIR